MSTILSLICLGPSFQKMTHHCLLHGSLRPTNLEKNLKPCSDCYFQARTGDLAIEDMDGGTFTISNGGVFGSMFGTPIINPPQSAILGMHAIIDRPMAINGKVRN